MNQDKINKHNLENLLERLGEKRYLKFKQELNEYCSLLEDKSCDCKYEILQIYFVNRYTITDEEFNLIYLDRNKQLKLDL